MKLSQYNLVVENDEGIVVYNFLLSKGIRIHKNNENEIKHFRELLSGIPLKNEDAMVISLYNAGFIVDDNVNEFEKAKSYIDSYKKGKNKTHKITILVTDNCNFNCIYCFKKAIVKDFSKESWNNLYTYIDKQLINSDINTIDIHFYGGEPLLKVNNIINFMKRANNLVSKFENKKIIYHMTTNGYLLVPDKYNKLVSLGLRSFQISLDGFAEQHNKTRPRVDGAGTWDKIVKNLKYINSVEDNAHIVLRTNCSPINISIIEEYDKWSRKVFNNKKFEIQYEPVSMFSSMVDKNLVIDSSDPVCYELYKLSKQDEVCTKCPNEFKKPGWRCEYANGNNFTISTSGKVYCCEDCDNDETCVGYLDKNGEIIYNKDIDKWFIRYEKEDCKTCIAYPICFAQSCFNEDKCQSVLNDLKQRIEDIQTGKFTL